MATEAQIHNFAFFLLTFYSLSSAPLHLSRVLYKSTLFMQNKPNLPEAQMNVTSFITTDYLNKCLRQPPKNKPNTNPIKPNLRKAAMFLNFYSTKDYENKRLCRCGENKPNQTQFQRQKNAPPDKIFLIRFNEADETRTHNLRIDSPML